MLAVLCNHIGCVKVLLKNGASMSRRFAGEETLTQQAENQGHDEMVVLLLEEEHRRSKRSAATYSLFYFHNRIGKAYPLTTQSQ